MKFFLDIAFVDGTKKQASAIAADLVAFETKFDLSIARLEKELKLTHLLYLGWHSEKRTGATDLDFEKWVELVDTIGAEAKK